MGDVRKNLDAIIKQRDALQQQIDSLRGYLEQPRPEIGDGPHRSWGEELAEHLTNLHEMLARHFRFEESSGLLDQLQRDHPRTAHRVGSLLRDHDRILAEFRAIMGAAMSYSEGKEPPNPQLRRWTSSILDLLTDHEREEMELLQRSYVEDLGGSG